MSLSCRQGGHQLRERDEIEGSPEIIGERGQAKLGANLLQATHQKCALIHPLFDRAKRVFDRLALANGNNLRISGDATRRTLLSNLDAGVLISP
jgi:hypothetical protein